MMSKKYKKIKAFRQSGLPVTLENLAAYDTEWRERYDAKLEEFKKGGARYDSPEGADLRAELDELEDELLNKYPTVDLWDWVTTQRDWKELTREYGPIALASDEGGKLCYIILDRI